MEKQKEKQKELAFVYFRHDKKSPSKKGIVCAAFNKTDDNKIEFSFLFCSPKDAFEKQYARKELTKRFKNGKTLSVGVYGNYRENSFTIAKEIDSFVPEGYNNTRDYALENNFKVWKIKDQAIPWWFNKTNKVPK